MTENNRSLTSVLKNRGFLNLWVNQILVQLAYNSLNFALLVWVYKLTDSSVAIAYLMVSIYLPPVLFGVFAGVLVDITDRKKIISLINLFMSLGLFGLIFLKGYFLVILILTFFINTLAIFYLASEASAIPLIVKKEQLLIANSLFSTTVFLMFLFGFGLSGPLISIFGVSRVFEIGSASLFLGFLLSLLMPPIVGKLDKQATLLNRSFQPT